MILNIFWSHVRRAKYSPRAWRCRYLLDRPDGVTMLISEDRRAFDPDRRIASTEHGSRTMRMAVLSGAQQFLRHHYRTPRRHGCTATQQQANHGDQHPSCNRHVTSPCPWMPGSRSADALVRVDHTGFGNGSGRVPRILRERFRMRSGQGIRYHGSPFSVARGRPPFFSAPTPPPPSPPTSPPSCRPVRPVRWRHCPVRRVWPRPGRWRPGGRS